MRKLIILSAAALALSLGACTKSDVNETTADVKAAGKEVGDKAKDCLLYTSPSPRDS